MIKQIKLFPTSVYATVLDIDTSLKEKLVDSIYKLKSDNLMGEYRSNNGGWHSSYDEEKDSYDLLSFDDNFKLLKNKICLCLEELLDNYYKNLKEFNKSMEKNKDINFDKLIHHSWSIINSKGDSNYTHTHQSNWLSGVYYLRAPENSGNLKFLDTNLARVHEGNIYSPTNLNHELTGLFKPAENVLFVFPAWLHHSVTRSNSTEDRICISFNVKYPFYNLEGEYDLLMRGKNE